MYLCDFNHIEVLSFLKNHNLNIFVVPFAAAWPPVNGERLLELIKNDCLLLNKYFRKVGTRLQRKKLERTVINNMYCQYESI